MRENSGEVDIFADFPEKNEEFDEFKEQENDEKGEVKKSEQVKNNREEVVARMPEGVENEKPDDKIYGIDGKIDMNSIIDLIESEDSPFRLNEKIDDLSGRMRGKK